MSPIQILFVVFSFERRVWAGSTDDIFTAISELEPLLKTNERVISDLSDYIAKTERRISLLIKYLNKLKNEHERASKNKLIYIQNPMNAFKLIRGLTTDLKDIEDIILAEAEDSQKYFLYHADLRYPSFEDLFGAAIAIGRIQTTYELSPSDLEGGIFNEIDNIVGSSPFTTNEYYDLSYMLYSAYKYEHALSWMLQALRSYESGDKGEDGFTRAEIMEFIAWCHYMLNDDFKVIEWMEKVLTENPWHTRAPHYINYLVYRGINQCKPNEVPEESIQSAEEEKNEALEFYEPLCRGELEISREVSKKLYCRYSARNHPFMKLAPIKMEQLYEQPDVFMFYDVLTEAEIEMFKNYSLKKLERSSVVSDEPIMDVDYRISKGAWVADSYSQAVAKVSQRVSDITGLNVTWAEEFHIINYGIGGHYEPHFDFATKAEGGVFPNATTGNRIATFLIYMTGVEKGGATVFPKLGLTVFPIRNAALYWDNLHSSGEGDNATLHGACPVLYGSKWIGTKWIHQHGQELIRPCNLEYQDEGFSRDIPKPLYRHSNSS